MTLHAQGTPAVPPAVSGPVTQDGGHVQFLKERLSGQEGSLVSLHAQRAELQRQITALPANANVDLRQGLHQSLVELDQRIVGTEVEIAGTRAELATKGPSGTEVPPPFPDFPGNDHWISPDALTGLIVFVTVAIVAPLSIG